MIDEQYTLYVKFGRWEDSANVYELHSIGVDAWLKPIRELMEPIDFRTPSLLDRVAGYMSSQGFHEHGELLKKAVSVFIEQAKEFGEKAIAETKDFNDLRVKLKPQSLLRVELDRVFGIMYNVAEMSRSFQENDGDFNSAVNALEMVRELPVENVGPVATNRVVIKRPSLIKQLGWDNSTINKRPGFPNPISKNEKPQRYYVDEINSYLKSRGEPLLDVE